MGRRFPLRTSLFGISLRHGCLFLSCFSLVASLLGVVACTTYLGGRLEDKMLGEDEYRSLCTNIIVMVFLFLANAGSVIGILKENLCLLAIWILFHILFSFYIMHHAVLSLFQASKEGAVLYGIGVLAFYTSVLVFIGYTLLVVISYIIHLYIPDPLKECDSQE